MTIRAIAVGLLLGLPLAALGWLNDWVLGQAYVASDLLPGSVYGLLIVGLLVAQPLLRLLGGLHLRGAEWAVIVAVMLMACVIPGPGLLWTFNNTLVMPHNLSQNNPSWQERRLLEYLPPQMLADPGDKIANPHFYDRAAKGFATGLRTDTRWIGVEDVPWAAWTRTLAFWMPLLALGFVGGICLMVLVHRQWAHRERLRYPIAEFAGELLAGTGDGFYARIFHNRRFWIGFGIAFSILMVNGADAWGQTFRWNTLSIPLGVDMREIMPLKWPFLRNYPSHWGITFPRMYFVVVGLAYFVSSEVSFTLGISSFLHLALYYVLYQSGVGLAQQYSLGGSLFTYQYFGAYLGMGLMILYIGRRFYGTVLRNAVGLATPDRATAAEVWACRLAALAAAGMVALLVNLGLNWLLAILFVLLSGLLFLLVARINVETGLFCIQPSWHAVTILIGLFGVTALGPRTLVMLGMLAAVMTIDPRVAAMPLAANALRMADREGVRPGRLGTLMGVAIVLALVLGVTATLYWQYNYGATQHGWLSMPAAMPFGLLEQALPSFDKISPACGTAFPFEAFKLDRMFVFGTSLGLALVLGCSFLRLRYQWWPIHPVLFLVWGTFPMQCFAYSFLGGWLLKSAVSKFGGGDGYRRNKPLFAGLIAGELVASLAWTVIGLLYYVCNNYVAGPSIRFHP